MEYNPPKHPLTFFWIATYSDNQCYPQFHPDNCKENKFKTIKQDRLVKFGWYPFTESFAKKLCEHKILAEAKNLPCYELILEKDQRLIALRREKIERFQLHICLKCGETFKAFHKECYHVESIIQQVNNKDKTVTYASPICPKCGYYDVKVCPDCKISASKNKLKEHYCNKCQKKFTRLIIKKPHELRSTVYMLGWQKTVDSKNHKSILFIDEAGNCTVSDDFNKVVG